MSEYEEQSNDAAEKAEEKEDPRKVAARWIKELTHVEESRERKAFEKIGEDIVKRYRAAEIYNVYSKTAVKPADAWFNVLWSNVQILKPSLYARLPKVVVERRFKDSDPIGRLAALGAERATHFMLTSQQDRANWAIKSAVEDRLLAGLGTAWLRYEVEMGEAVNEETGEPVYDEESGEALEVPMPGSEKVTIDSVMWKDFFWSPARNPFEMRWRARRVYMSRKELVNRFPECGAHVPLNDDRKSNKGMSDDDKELLAQAEVFEIESYEDKKRYWISKDYDEKPLDVREDALRLNDFWCSPIPLLATTTTDSLYPTPDFKIYERLADELNYITKRISQFVDCIRAVGAMAKQFNQDVKNMLSLDDGSLWPIEGFSRFAESGGLKGNIDFWPFDQVAAALPTLISYRQELLDQINLITGIPDIAQGSTDPNETAEAQQRKSKWAVVKLEEKQKDVQRFCREIVSKMAEIIFEPGLFSDETIALMIGLAQMPPDDQQMWPQALALLRSDRLRTFRVDIETDSTIAIDEEIDQGSRLEYVQTVTQLLGQLQQIMQFRPELVSPMIESVLFTTRAFRTGRPLEGAWEAAMQKIEDNDEAAAEAAQNQPPPPDYDMMKLQNEQASIQVKQAELQMKQQSAQMNYEIDMQKLQMEGQKLFSKQQLDQMKLDLDAFKVEFEQQIEAERLELERVATQLSEREKLIEEQRLKQEDLVETVKLLAGNGEGNGNGAKAPVIHIHNGGKKRVTMTRDPVTGNLVGESEEVADG